jgi:hypothetical protein
MGFINFLKKKVGQTINVAKNIGGGVANVAKEVYKDVIKPGAKLAGKAWNKAAPYIAKYGDKAAEIMLTIPGLEEFAPLAEAVTKGAQGYEGGKALAKAFVDKNPASAVKAGAGLYKLVK